MDTPGSLKDLVMGDAGGSESGGAGSPSVLRTLNTIQQRLDASPAVRDRHTATGMRALARELLHAVELSPDVALACILRNQIGGSYAVRHSIETAVIASLVAHRANVRAPQILSLAAASLALHTVERGERDNLHVLQCADADDSEWFACILLAQADPETADTPCTTSARVLRMADRYCAAISARNYRRSLLPDEALRTVAETASDASLIEAFGLEIGPYPPGTAVRLASGETGVVAHRDGGRPTVYCLRDAHGHALPVPQARHVGRSNSESGCTIDTALSEDDAQLRVPMQKIWGPLASL